jgi:hypothetical protein
VVSTEQAFAPQRSRMGDPASSAAVYRRRSPERGALWAVLNQHLEPFLAKAACASDGTGLPSFVQRELRGYLACGVLARGLIRLHCDHCHRDDVVALSCKGRGFCERCGGRRMTERAAQLTDHVFPYVPVRQWVLTVPHALRYPLGYDHNLCRRVHEVFRQALFRHYRDRCGQPKGQSGSVTFIHRFNSALRLSPHFHLVAIDGVFVTDREEPLRFTAAPEPSELDVADVLASTRAGVARLLRTLGLDEREGEAAEDPLTLETPALAACYGGSIVGRSALDSSRSVQRLGAAPTRLGSMRAEFVTAIKTASTCMPVGLSTRTTAVGSTSSCDTEAVPQSPRTGSPYEKTVA